MTEPTTITVVRTSRITYYRPGPLLALLPGMTVAQTAEALDVSPGAVDKWRAGGCLNARTADRCATALGRHMGEIW